MKITKVCRGKYNSENFSIQRNGHTEIWEVFARSKSKEGKDLLLSRRLATSFAQAKEIAAWLEHLITVRWAA